MDPVSDSLTELRDALAAERRDGGLAFNDESEAETDAALAAVERDMAELRRTCPECGSPMPGESCAVCALALAEEELVELRKRDAEIAALREGKRQIVEAFVTFNRHCLGLNIPITETAWAHGHRISDADSEAGASMLAHLCALLGITVAEAQP